MRNKKHIAPTADEDTRNQTPLRVIGGSLRGRKLLYTGDIRTRPMKDRLRESIFNLLGTAARGKHVIDLFAGTGALGFEALSRGAATALFVERHFPTADVVRQNAAALGVTKQSTVLPANTLLWAKRLPELPAATWLVFCSPPYDFYVEHRQEMLALIEALVRNAPPESTFCVEADSRFDFADLPESANWDVRSYPPAVVGIWSKSI